MYVHDSMSLLGVAGTGDPIIPERWGPNTMTSFMCEEEFIIFKANGNDCDNDACQSNDDRLRRYVSLVLAVANNYNPICPTSGL